MALSGVIVPSLQINSPISVSNSGNKHLRHLGNVSLSALQLTQQGRLCLPRKVGLDSRVVRAMAESGTAGSKVEEKLGVRIERDPSESRLTELGIRSWPKWGCPPSKFPWTYDATETCFLLQGKVKVYPEGSSEFVEFGAGDLVVFPKGMSCTWDVSETVDKHYQFDY